MSSTAIATVAKMLESLPETVQDQVVEHLRKYLADLQDELAWDDLFKRTQPQLVAAARRAKEEITKGQAKPMDFDQRKDGRTFALTPEQTRWSPLDVPSIRATVRTEELVDIIRKERNKTRGWRRRV